MHIDTLYVIRCVNIDWLEVFCLELGERHDADYFRRAGFVVHEREYGTRVYHEMFTLEDREGHPYIEIRRNPKNPLVPQFATHLRFVNRACYYDDAALQMQRFIEAYQYQYCRISRIDICLDLVRFDDNTIPRVFMQRYMRGKFAKINQANIRSHGSDRWTGRVWNSVSWGSPSSQVSTKFYNKTLELFDEKLHAYGKPYIRQAWFMAGLIDDVDRCTLNGEQQEVWRIEFSIHSPVKKWLTIEKDGKSHSYQSIENDLNRYDSREKILALFASLCRHYFRFKRYQIGERKDRCPDRVLFKWNDVQTFYEIDHDKLMSENTPDDILLRLIKNLRLYIEHGSDVEARKQANSLLSTLQTAAQTCQYNKPWSYEHKLAMQQLLSRHDLGFRDDTYSTLLADICELLKMNKNYRFF